MFCHFMSVQLHLNLYYNNYNNNVSSLYERTFIALLKIARKMEENEELIYAKVKFIDDNFKATIPIEDIIELKSKRPMHANDCDPKFIYTCWYENAKNPDLRKYGIQVASFLCKSYKTPYNNSFYYF